MFGIIRVIKNSLTSLDCSLELYFRHFAAVSTNPVSSEEFPFLAVRERL